MRPSRAGRGCASHTVTTGGKVVQICSPQHTCFYQRGERSEGNSEQAEPGLHPLRKVGVDVVDRLPNTCKLSPDNPHLLPVMESSVYIKRLF